MTVYFGENDNVRYGVALMTHYGWVAWVSYRSGLDYSPFERLTTYAFDSENDALEYCSSEAGDPVVWRKCREFFPGQVVMVKDKYHNWFSATVVNFVSPYTIELVFDGSDEGPVDESTDNVFHNQSEYIEDLVDEDFPILEARRFAFEFTREGRYDIKDYFDRGWMWDSDYFWDVYDNFVPDPVRPKLEVVRPIEEVVELPPYLVQAADRIDALLSKPDKPLTKDNSSVYHNAGVSQTLSKSSTESDSSVYHKPERRLIHSDLVKAWKTSRQNIMALVSDAFDLVEQQSLGLKPTLTPLTCTHCLEEISRLSVELVQDDSGRLYCSLDCLQQQHDEEVPDEDQIRNDAQKRGQLEDWYYKGRLNS